MNSVKKLTAVALAAAMAVSAAGCADQSWSYKTDNASLSAGTYIYNLLNGYYEAADLVESPDEVKDMLKAEVTGSDEDAVTKTVEQYAYDVADETSTRMMAVEDLFNSYGLTLDETEDEAALSYASQVWSTSKKTLEGYGISEESFNYCYADYSVKYGQVFEYVYGENGDKTVTDDDLRAYFKDNYTGYAYFTLSMADTNEDGESVAKSDEEFAKAETNMAEYVKMINDGGKSYKDAVSKYIKDYALEVDPTYSGSNKNDELSSGLDADVAAKLGELGEGKAAFVKTGEDATTLYYFVYKPKYSEIEDYLDNDSANAYAATTNDDGISIYNLKSGYTRYTLLNDMKGDEFKDFLNEHAASINITKNQAALKKYSPKMFISKDSDD